MKLTVKRLSTGWYHIRGHGPCNWAQVMTWPCTVTELKAGTFPEASTEFRASTQAANAALHRQGVEMTLTKRQLEALRLMRDEGEELVYERGECFVGNERFGRRTFFALLRHMAIRHVEGEPGGFERYDLNETGQALLATEAPR